MTPEPVRALVVMTKNAQALPVWASWWRRDAKRKHLQKKYVAVMLVVGILSVAGSATDGFASEPTQSPRDNPILERWIKTQARLRTWSADFVQTRHLKALIQPLTNRGHVWFEAPNQFRWELGSPPRTIAIRRAHEFILIYPRLKRVERYSLKDLQSGPWQGALALLDAGFPRSQNELERHFKIGSIRAEKDLVRIKLEPRASAARRLLLSILVTATFTPQYSTLRSTQLQFADGSSLVNQFEHSRRNLPLDPARFQPTWGADYEVVEPLKDH